ncbi:MAG: hypothetical protein A2W18_09065 [Candidatus Muproteobacteria bacterium RBG_16_60_9]|uniref:Porin domain-containing protein n=1 Tax=Candidatus Muproteobacteria bacterium RBG_16_60_9 TaxID=1817755 RepID=A0A1F6V299_9PROT|nr:MAG: hypothetical protein A2W18_09065 [Candidatus Muproteobacteria bacterium RBG_16_60_9]
MYVLTLDAYASDRAVAETNGSVGANYIEGGSVGTSISVNTPVADYLGLTFGVSFLDTDFARFYTASSGLFVRDMSIGHVGLFAGLGEVDAKASPVIDSTSTDYGVRGAYYLNTSFDIFASRSNSRARANGFSAHVNLGSVGLGWFASPDVRVALLAGLLDQSDRYVATILFQPTLFGGKASFGIAYADGSGVDSQFAVAFVYYFGPAKTLMKRFREDLFY